MSTAGNFIKNVLLTGLIAGILDLFLGVLAYYLLSNGHLPENITVYIKNVLEYIASAAFGKDGANAVTMQIAGFLFHFFIAISFAWFYFLIYPKVKLFQKSIVASAIIYGLFVWAVMNMAVVPLSALHSSVIPKDFTKASYQALVLIVCIALPVSLGAQNYYRRNS